VWSVDLAQQLFTGRVGAQGGHAAPQRAGAQGDQQAAAVTQLTQQFHFMGGGAAALHQGNIVLLCHLHRRTGHGKQLELHLFQQQR
jgi:hypothetical protein